MYVDIAGIGNDKTLQFALNELCAYLGMAGVSVRRFCEKEYKNDETSLWVGISSGFEEFLPAVEDEKLDDGIYINVENGAGIITGTNPRSVLIAVYRFLKELGFAWIRPGKDGEIVPLSIPEKYSVKVCEAAAYRHRAICIEGAVSYEHVRSVIDWIPKASMNGYYIQFRVPFTFFDRWYSHKDNPTLTPELISYDDIAEIMKKLEREIDLRGLMYHTVGHGWTCEPLGIRGLGWDKVEEDFSDDVREKLALVNGKRGLWDGVPLNTSLCYSNPEVRALMSDAVLDYCRHNPQADYVHVWLADGVNNNCECKKCKEKMPSDYYVMLLNEIDRKLTAAGVETKIVFLMYLDLLWVFEEGEIENPDRFVMMFAPITRSYTTKYTDFDENEKVELAPYVRNNLCLPRRVEENMAYLRSWQAKFHGDSVDFDYHLMWDHLKDPGYYRCAEILFSDTQGLDKVGLNGYISCQLQRAAFPTGLPMEMMAKGLWSKKYSFNEEAKAYFATAFGEKSEDVRLYLKTLSEQFVPPYIRGELERVNESVAESLQAAKRTILGFEKNISEGIAATDGAVRRSWEYLSYHASLNLLFADMLIAQARGDDKEAFSRSEELIAYVRQIESDVHNVLDVCLYIHVVRKVLDGVPEV